MLEWHRMTEAEKYIVTEWKYEGEYVIYNCESYDVQKARGYGFANPKNIAFAFYDDDTLVGFTCLYEEDAEVFFGIGVNPSSCGMGYGQRMTLKTVELSRALFPGKPLYLEVRAWNQRAVKCYEKAGFRIEGEPFVQTTSVGEGTFYRMVTDQVR